jgi:hypothetical protein
MGYYVIEPPFDRQDHLASMYIRALDTEFPRRRFSIIYVEAVIIVTRFVTNTIRSHSDTS